MPGAGVRGRRGGRGEGARGGDAVELRPVRRDHRQGRPADPARGRLRPRVHADLNGQVRGQTPDMSGIDSRGDSLGLDDILAARQTIAGRVHRTPTFSSATLSELTGAHVYLKAELFQRTGSFKPRGVLNKLAALTSDERTRGVIGISAGNHAQALAWGAREEGLSSLVVMWADANPTKVAAARGYGAEVDLAAAGPAEAFERLDELVAGNGPDARPPVRRPAGDGGAGDGRARAARRRARDRRGRRPGRRRRPDLGDRHGRQGQAPGRQGDRASSRSSRRLSTKASGPARRCPCIRARSPTVSARPSPASTRSPSVGLAGSSPFWSAKTRSRTASASSTAVPSSPASPAGAATTAALLAGKIAFERGQTVVAVVSGGNAAPETATAILARR